MAIYKPNNFYPYMDEIDMRDLNGNIFSCQANTNGVPVSGAKLQIKSFENNIVLYENLYQFKDIDYVDYEQIEIKRPIENQNMVDLEVKPFLLNIEKDLKDGNFKIKDISFISLSSKEAMNNFKDMCPYNFYEVKIKDAFYYELIVVGEKLKNAEEILKQNDNSIIPQYLKSEILDFISLTRIEEINGKDNKYDIVFPYSYFNEYDSVLKDSNKENVKYDNNDIPLYKNVQYYITLKNNFDYLWNTRLYEHYFDDINIDNCTFITDGYVTGSTKNVLWYDINNQSKEIQDNQNKIIKDKYVEISATTENSDLFYEDVKNNFSTKGTLKLSSSGTTEFNTNNNLLIDSVDTEQENKYDKIDEIDNNYLKFSKLPYYYSDYQNEHVGFFNNYYYDEYGMVKKKKDIKESWKTDLVLYGDYPLRSNRYTKYETNWEIIKDVNIKVKNVYNEENNNYENVFKIDCNNAFSSGVTLSRYIAYSEEKWYQNYFMCPTAETTVIGILKSRFDDNTFNKYDILDISGYAKCYNDSDFKKINIEDLKEKAETSLYSATINGMDYYIQILSPAPYCSEFYDISIDTVNECLRFDPDSNLYKSNDNSITNKKVCLDSYIYKNCFNACMDLIGWYDYFNVATNITMDVFMMNYFRKDGKIYLYDNNTYSNLKEIYQEFSYSFLKDYQISGKFSVYCDSDNYKKNRKGKINITIFEKDDYNNNYKISKEIDITNSAGSCVNSEGVSVDTDYTSFSFTLNDILGDNLKTISLKFRNPYIRISLPIEHNADRYDAVLYGNILFDFTIFEKKNFENKLFLKDDTVDISKYIDYMYIYFPELPELVKKESEDIKKIFSNNVQKIKKYDFFNHVVYFEDSIFYNALVAYMANLSKDNSTVKEIYYELIYKQREKITWTKKDLGFFKKYNKIETENEFKINLKNNAEIQLYESSNKNTYNSFFGVKDVNLNVEDIYIRFPGYVGKDAMGNDIKDNKKYYDSVDNSIDITTREEYLDSTGKTQYKEKKYNGKGIAGWFYQDGKYYSSSTDKDYDYDYETHQPISLYGKKVREEAFKRIQGAGTVLADGTTLDNDRILDDDNTTSEYSTYCKLFKVSNYNYETGEFVIAGGLDRIILDTDYYEVWKKEAIEGTDNKYDITNVKSYYSRLYPPAEEENFKENKVNQNAMFEERIKIMNSTNYQVFMQPCSNFLSDKYISPYMILNKNKEKLSMNYNEFKMNEQFFIKDLSIETLDNSQWLIQSSSALNSDIYPGMTYKLYQDYVDMTPDSFFYARNIGKIDIKFGEYNHCKAQFDNISLLDYDNLKEQFNSLDNEKIGNACVIRCMDVYFMPIIKNIDIQIKRYRYKLYNKNMELIHDSGNIVSNKLNYGIRGFENNSVYFFMFECEDELGLLYNYEQSIIAKYDIKEIEDIKIDFKNFCSQNAVKITINNKQNDFDKYNDLENYTLYIYRREKNGNIYFIEDINLIQDRKYYGYNENNDYVYGFVDYGVINNEIYDYIFIVGIKDISNNNYSNILYYGHSETWRTMFDSWSIVNIIEKDDGKYTTDGIVWTFKYNLESGDISNNTSVTKWDTLGQYANFSSGNKGYDSSSLTCLLGDVGTYYSYDNNYLKEHYGYFEKNNFLLPYQEEEEIDMTQVCTNNIERFQTWKKFCRDGQLKLLKDIKGNKWIVGIAENPSTKIDTNSREQMATISFDWFETMDSTNVSIVGEFSSLDIGNEIIDKLSEYLSDWEYTYDNENLVVTLNELKNISNYSITIPDSIVVETKVIKINLRQSELTDTGNYNNIFSTIEENRYNYTPVKEYIIENVLSENKNMDYLMINNTNIESFSIILSDNVNSIQHAFSGCSNATGRISITTENYINTNGIIDNVEKCEIVWSENINPDLQTYAELYEQYWNNDKIILNCPQLEFNLDEWEFDEDENSITEDGITYDKRILLKEYKGNKESIFIPKSLKYNDKIYEIQIDSTIKI